MNKITQYKDKIINTVHEYCEHNDSKLLDELKKLDSELQELELQKQLAHQLEKEKFTCKLNNCDITHLRYLSDILVVRYDLYDTLIDQVLEVISYSPDRAENDPLKGVLKFMKKTMAKHSVLETASILINSDIGSHKRAGEILLHSLQTKIK